MARKRFNEEQILDILRPIELSLASGADGGDGVPFCGGERRNLLRLAQEVWRHGQIAAP